LRDDLERLKKIRAHRGLRHFWGLRVRGQHTKTTGELLVFAPSPSLLNVAQAVAGRLSVFRRSAARWIALHCPLVLCILHYQYGLTLCHYFPRRTLSVLEKLGLERDSEVGCGNAPPVMRDKEVVTYICSSLEICGTSGIFARNLRFWVIKIVYNLTALILAFSTTL
jgi:hypothetical protein